MNIFIENETDLVYILLGSELHFLMDWMHRIDACTAFWHNDRSRTYQCGTFFLSTTIFVVIATGCAYRRRRPFSLWSTIAASPRCLKRVWRSTASIATPTASSTWPTPRKKRSARRAPTALLPTTGVALSVAAVSRDTQRVYPLPDETL